LLGSCNVAVCADFFNFQKVIKLHALTDQVGNFFKLVESVFWVMQNHNLEDVAEVVGDGVAVAVELVRENFVKVAKMQILLRNDLRLEC